MPWESLCFLLKGTESVVGTTPPSPPALNSGVMPGSASAISKNEKRSRVQTGWTRKQEVGPQGHLELRDQPSGYSRLPGCPVNFKLRTFLINTCSKV